MTDTIDCNVTRRGVLAGGAASAALTSIPASAQTPAPSAGAAPAAMPVRMTVNGKPQALNLDPRTTLLLHRHEEGLRPWPVRRLHGDRQRHAHQQLPQSCAAA